MAGKLGISSRTLARCEAGSFVGRHTLATIAKAFGLTADDLTTALQDLPRTRRDGTAEVIQVFVASPGDLGEERMVFRSVVDEVNKIKARSLGYSIEPLGWEDTLPGKGRPQALINEDVRKCHLFVLLLWKRWGTFSGQYSSGTEEEFEIARALNEKTQGVPEIWLYFKSIPEYMLADPGEQLQKVLKFRTKIEAERSFLYRMFDDPPQWEPMFREHLCRWLDEQKPFEPAPTSVTFPDEVAKRIEELAASVSASSPTTAQTALQMVALKLGRRGIDAATRGRLTEAETLFASSIETLPLPETLNAYAIYLEFLGKRRKADEQAYQLRDLYALRGKIEAERAAQASSPMVAWSCFISCSNKDQTFVERLYTDLQSNGIKCWYAPQNLKIGDDFSRRIDEAINVAERVVLVLSENSVGSAWMEFEVEAALARETASQTVGLFPIRLDESVMESNDPWAAMLRRTRHIGDFRLWKDHDSYLQAFRRLLRDMQAS
jgi:hypothetical protein